jgi:hypothetical protein
MRTMWTGERQVEQSSVGSGWGGVKGDKSMRTYQLQDPHRAHSCRSRILAASV